MRRILIVALMSYAPVVAVALLSLALNWTHGEGSFWPGVIVSTALATLSLPLNWTVWARTPSERTSR